MQAITALAGKDLKLLLRDKAGFFFTFLFPLFYATLFGAIMSGFGDDETSLQIAVVDEDNSGPSKAFADSLNQAEGLQVMSATRDEATDLVRRGKLAAFVVLTDGFGEASGRMFFGDPPKVELGLDPSRRAESGMLQGLLMRTAAERMQSFFSDPQAISRNADQAIAAMSESQDMDPVWRGTLQAFLGALKNFSASMPTHGNDAADGNIADSDGGGFAPSWEPIQFETVPISRRKQAFDNTYEISFPQSCVWAMMGCAAGFGISLVTERTRGTLLRLRVAPLDRSQVLAGKALACWVTILGVMVMLFGLGIFAFGIKPDSFLLLLIGVVSASICFVGVMMFLSVLGKTEQSAGGIGWAIMMVMAMIGGGMVPFAFLPAWLQSIGSISPVKWAILAMEGAIWRNFTYAEMALPCVILVLTGLGTFALGARTFRWSAES